MDANRRGRSLEILPPLLSLLVWLATSAPVHGETNPELVPNGGFEDGVTGWSAFTPEESHDKHCEFTVVQDQPHSGNSCAKLTSADFARFAVATKPVPVIAGSHYRISVWYRAGSQAEFSRRSPGFSIRLTLSGVRLQIGAEGVIVPGNPPAMKNPMPTEWKQLSAVIEVPPGGTSLMAELFSYAKGPVFFDDLSIQHVEPSEPVTPLSTGVAYSSLATVSATSGPTSPVMPATPGPLTTDAQIIAELNLDLPGMEKLKAAVQGGQIAEIEAAYLDYRRHESKVRWKTMPSDKPATPVETTDKVGDLVAAHNVMRDGYHYGPPACFMGKDFNWLYNPVSKGDPTYSDEFSYCVVSRTESWEHVADAYWKTGDEKYAKAWVELLEDFALKNPVPVDAPFGSTLMWRTLDSATRMDVSWPYCYFRFLDSPSFTPEAQWIYLKMMRDHALRLTSGLKDITRTGNWVTDECDALYTIGALFPELKTSSSWRDAGIDRLTIECNRTVQPDGVESELTPGYHFGALGQFRGPFDLAKLNNLPIPSLFKEKILSMYRSMVIVMQQNGQDVCTNDSWIVNARRSAKDGLQIGDDPVLAWAASGGKAGTPLPDSTCLPYAGFYTMRSGWDWNDMFVFFRGGPPGSGHEHQDKLEVTLRAWDNDLLIDPGTYTYDKSNFRRYFIGTAAHDTILVDGKWQHRPNNIPPVSTPADCPWVTTPLFDYVAGTYSDGYQESDYAPIEFSPQKWAGELDKTVSHTRRVLYLRPYCVLVFDQLDGTGNHSFEAHWHIGPPNDKSQTNTPTQVASAGRIDSSTQAYFSDRGSDVNLALFPLEREHLTVDVAMGQKGPLLGWAVKDGKAFPTPTVRFIKQQDAPAVFATVLYPYQKDNLPAVTGQALAAGDGMWGQTIITSREKAEVVLSKDGSCKAISIQSGLAGSTISAQAAGLILRQPTGQSNSFVGGWGMREYNDGAIAFTADASADLAFRRGTNPLFFNAGDQPIVLKLSRPAAHDLPLPPKTWTDSTGSPAAAPELFEPLVASKKKSTH
jgi:hypothetical protein